MRHGRIAMVCGLLIAAVACAGIARAEPSQPDRHFNYPPVPYGYSQLVKTFGKPCNSTARRNAMYLVAMDNRKMYAVRYHAKLGDPTSSNIEDIRNHILWGGYDDSLKSGIWGYNCRYIAGTKKYSVHAWGAAIDINSAYEHVGHYHSHTVPTGLGNIWRAHNWRWGLDWADAMHFQYASGY